MMWQQSVCKLIKMLHFRVYFNADWGENGSLEQIPTEYLSVSVVSVGSWVKSLCRPSLSLHEPKFQQGQSCRIHTVEGMVLPDTWMSQVQLWKQAPWHLTSWSLRSLPSLPQWEKHFSLEKIFPMQWPPPKTLQRPTYTRATCFLMVSSSDLVVFGGSQLARLVWAGHWNASEQWFC